MSKIMSNNLSNKGENLSMNKPDWELKLCNFLLVWLPRATVVALPLFLLPWTSEVLEFNKQALLFVVAGLLGLAFLIKTVLTQELETRKSWVNGLVLVWLAVLAASAVWSKSTYVGLVGDFGTEMSSFLTVFAMALVYFVVASTVKTATSVKKLLGAVMLGGFLTSVFTLLQGLGIYLLPFAFSKTSAFNGLGTITAVGMYLVAIFVLSAGSLLYDHHLADTKSSKLGQLFLVVNCLLALTVVAEVDFFPVTLSLLLAAAILIAFTFWHAKRADSLKSVVLPVLAVIMSLLLLVFNLPAQGRFRFPTEVLPTISASWQITMTTVKNNLLLGSGPGTFINDYAKYRAQNVNNTSFWDVRFDRSGSDVLTTLATTGVLGLLAWLALVAAVAVTTLRTMSESDEKTRYFLVGLVTAWLGLLVGRFLYSSNLTLEFMFWILTALLVSKCGGLRTKIFSSSPRWGFVAAFATVLVIAGLAVGYTFETKRYLADVVFAQATQLNPKDTNFTNTGIGLLTKATTYNSANDVYVRNLAEFYLNKGQTDLNKPLDLQRNSDESDAAFRQRTDAANNVKVTAAAASYSTAVNLGKRATELNPANVINWAALGGIYQAMVGLTQGADNWAIQAFQSAIKLEPNNPSYYVETGKVYAKLYDRLNVGAKNITDEQKKTQNTNDANDALNNAVNYYNMAIARKSDFAPAHYNLALVYDKQGKRKEAIAKLEQTIRLNPQDVGIGFQLALMYFGNNQKDQAVALMERVVSLSPNFSNARWYLASMYKDKGKFDQALAQINEVAKLNPNNPTVQQELDDLNKKIKSPSPLPPPLEQSPKK